MLPDPSPRDSWLTCRAALPAEAIQRLEIAGSLRRWKESIGDVDILVVSETPATVMEAFRSLPQVADVAAAGETKHSVILTTGLQVDLRVVEAQHWGAALQYFTGSKEHNVPLRELALKQGWSLNEYGLTATGKGDAAEDEHAFLQRGSGSLRLSRPGMGAARTARESRRIAGRA